MSWTKSSCEVCKNSDLPLKRFKLTYMCREFVRAFVALWAKAGMG